MGGGRETALAVGEMRDTRGTSMGPDAAEKKVGRVRATRDCTAGAATAGVSFTGAAPAPDAGASSRVDFKGASSYLLSHASPLLLSESTSEDRGGTFDKPAAAPMTSASSCAESDATATAPERGDFGERGDPVGDAFGDDRTLRDGDVAGDDTAVVLSSEGRWSAGRAALPPLLLPPAARSAGESVRGAPPPRETLPTELPPLLAPPLLSASTSTIKLKTPAGECGWLAPGDVTSPPPVLPPLPPPPLLPDRSRMPPDAPLGETGELDDDPKVERLVASMSAAAASAAACVGLRTDDVRAAVEGLTVCAAATAAAASPAPSFDDASNCGDGKASSPDGGGARGLLAPFAASERAAKARAAPPGDVGGGCDPPPPRDDDGDDGELRDGESSSNRDGDSAAMEGAGGADEDSAAASRAISSIAAWPAADDSQRRKNSST